jgi:hypothetical protein
MGKDRDGEAISPFFIRWQNCLEDRQLFKIKQRQDKQTNKQMNKPANEQTNKQANKQTNEQTNNFEI